MNPNPSDQPFQKNPYQPVLERTTLDEGPVNLTMPESLSAESVEEFEYWAQGIIRRIRRNAGMPKTDLTEQ